jgi:hypothetical protein
MKVPYCDFHRNGVDNGAIVNPYEAHENSDDDSDHAFPGFNASVRNKNRISPDPLLGKFSLINH